LTEGDTVREGTQAGGVGEGEAGFPQSREPDAGILFLLLLLLLKNLLQ